MSADTCCPPVTAAPRDVLFLPGQAPDNPITEEGDPQGGPAAAGGVAQGRGRGSLPVTGLMSQVLIRSLCLAAETSPREAASSPRKRGSLSPGSRPPAPSLAPASLRAESKVCSPSIPPRRRVDGQPDAHAASAGAGGRVDGWKGGSGCRRLQGHRPDSACPICGCRSGARGSRPCRCVSRSHAMTAVT